ncbi:hypothetical protein CcI49_11340 [Frankia sp. CcI49]|nr:hypothetical protein CcI49_11340 [Frankia sp. CcI49]
MIQGLERNLYVLRVADRPGYVLGPGALKFGLNGHLRLLAANRRRMTALAREVNEGVGLAVFSGREAVLVDEVFSPARPSELASKVGRSAALHATATGRALIAQMSDEEMPRILQGKAVRYTEWTVTDEEQLANLLDDTRQSGIATCVEEHDVGVGAVATALTGSVGILQTICVVLPIQRLRAKSELVIGALRRVNPDVDVDLAVRQLQTRLTRTTAAAAGARRACGGSGWTASGQHRLAGSATTSNGAARPRFDW